MNYCLIYDVFETAADGVEDVRLVNYCLIYRTSETGAIAAGTLIAGELLLELRYFQNPLAPKLPRL